MRTDAFTKTYDGRRVLSMPEFEFDEKSVYAVIGANGSGKSTLARILSGTIQPDCGKYPASGGLSIGYMPQKSFAFGMTLKKNLLLNGAGAGSGQRADELLRKMQLEELAGKNAHGLSGGETQRMALCRLMMRDYQLLILDEPTASMDVEASLLAEALIREYQNETGCIVILITHSLPQAARAADNLIFLHAGAPAEWGRLKAMMDAPRSDAFREYLDFCLKR